ncbi:MAG TPA: hypothetical protein VFO34_16025 [Candidatus Acidoferrales bacterium]|nr:hypothetical protein [Candidatus Acidoferrales bacterium]
MQVPIAVAGAVRLPRGKTERRALASRSIDSNGIGMQVVGHGNYGKQKNQRAGKSERTCEVSNASSLKPAGAPETEVDDSRNRDRRPDEIEDYFHEDGACTIGRARSLQRRAAAAQFRRSYEIDQMQN